ncbi:MAG: hypothetical protein HDT28_08715 [Clostridiales bacterium]|nr:hypothetical protein [Clostridiales bacterium]
MKKLVTEINKETLTKYLPIFGIDSQVTILDDAQATSNDICLNSKGTPFYIEENIIDLNSILSLCDDIDNAKSPIRKKIIWGEFCDFWVLIINIKKQREFGYSMSDIEYIYKKGVELNLPIKLQQASTDLGFYPDVNYLVITGKSQIGEMLLYQEDENDFLEYVFSLQYLRIKKFSKKKEKAGTHWHPRGYQKAIEDMIAFMNNDEEYFRNVIKLRI